MKYTQIVFVKMEKIQLYASKKLYFFHFNLQHTQRDSVKEELKTFLQGVF